MASGKPSSGDGVVLDISRLLSRIQHHTPSGVDRVEMAYARGLDAKLDGRLRFAAVHPFGVYGRIPRDAALRYLDLLERRWDAEEGSDRKRSLAGEMPRLLALLPRRPEPLRNAVYVQASPNHLDRRALVQRKLAREQARFLCLVHDLIPIEYPEYARPDGAAQHRRRIETVAALADGVIVNSRATGASLEPWVRAAGRAVDVRVALLGTHEPAAGSGGLNGLPDDPYFLCVGTIEPRKNHLLLLNLWRTMAAGPGIAPGGDAVPRLVIVGRRGWENEQIIDMLERCPALKGHVEERNGCSDRRMHDLLRGARALLFPSFAEGYGMPVAEALSAGTPVICSDLPALREAGGAIPDFLDPLDGPAWAAHILDYARGGPLSVAQRERLAHWRAPSWTDHFAIVGDAIEALRARA